MAARQLRQADGPTQRSVIDRGSLTDCRNPSAVCLARIRDARQSPPSPVQAPAPAPMASPPAMMCGGYGGYVAPMYGAHPGYGAGYGGGYSNFMAGYGACPGYGSYGASGYPSGFPGYPGACGGG